MFSGLSFELCGCVSIRLQLQNQHQVSKLFCDFRPFDNFPHSYIQIKIDYFSCIFLTFCYKTNSHIHIMLHIILCVLAPLAVGVEWNAVNQLLGKDGSLPHVLCQMGPPDPILSLSCEVRWRRAAWGGQSSSRGSGKLTAVWTHKQTCWKPRRPSFSTSRTLPSFWSTSIRLGFS